MRKLRHEEIPRITPEDGRQKPRHPICAIADNVRSIHNVGSFFRTSDGAWIEKIYLTGITGTPENRALHKTALGAQDTIPWEYVPDVAKVITLLKAKGYQVFALEISNHPMLYKDLKLASYPVALVVGNELTGVSTEVMALVDGVLEIPQYGTKQSLNVAVAYGIAVFDLVRHYRTLKGQHLMDDAFTRPLEP